MELIAVIMKGTTSDSRNTDAKTLLNYGFSTYTLADVQPEEPLPVLPVTLGTADTVAADAAGGGPHAAAGKEPFRRPDPDGGAAGDCGRRRCRRDSRWAR